MDNETTQTSQGQENTELEQSQQLESQENAETKTGQSEFDDWDKETSVNAYRNLQQKINDREKALKQAEQEQIRAQERARFLEEQLKSLNKPEEKPAQKKITSLPPMPNDFTMAEALDESTSSGQWWKMKLQYDLEKDNEIQSWREEIEQERQRQAQEQQKAQYRNSKIGELQQAGATLQEAMETFDWLISEESGNPENILAYKRFLSQKSKPAPPPTPKTNPTPSLATTQSKPQEQVNKSEYVKPADFNWMYKTK